MDDPIRLLFLLQMGILKCQDFHLIVQDQRIRVEEQTL